MECINCAVINVVYPLFVYLSVILSAVDLMETSKFLPIANAACQALGSIFRSGTLPLPTNKEDGQENRKEGDDRESKAGIGGIGTIAEGTREEGESVKGKGSGESLEEVKEGVQVMDIQGDGRNIIKEKGGEGGADEKKGSAEVSMEVDNEEEEEEEMVVVSKAELVNSLVQLSKSSQFDKVSYIQDEGTTPLYKYFPPCSKKCVGTTSTLLLLIILPST